MTYEGYNHLPGNLRTTSIPKDDAARLFAQVECSGFWGWPSFEERVTDTTEGTVTVRLGLRAKILEDNGLCPVNGHPELCALEEKIDAAAGSLQWIRCRDHAGAFTRCPDIIR